jgi:head-tail adaptor
MSYKLPSYSAGDFRRLAVIQRETRVADGAGGWNSSWAQIGTAWGKLKTGSASEKYADSSEGNVKEARTETFITWWRNDIAVGDRLTLSDANQSRIYNIRAVENLESSSKYLILSLESGVPT